MLQKLWYKLENSDMSVPETLVIVIPFSILTVILIPISIIMWFIGYRNCFNCLTPVAIWKKYKIEYRYGSFGERQAPYRVCERCLKNKSPEEFGVCINSK